MAEETTQDPPTSANSASEDAQGVAALESEAQLDAESAIDQTNTPSESQGTAAAIQAQESTDQNKAQELATDGQAAVTAEKASEPESPNEPDELQPFIDKAKEITPKEVEDEALEKFLRAHIKTFREEWDIWSDAAKNAYIHMMASQLLRRKAEGTQISLYAPYTLPVPSAQTTLFESIKQSQVKPKKCIPVLLLPPNLRPTYSLKS